VEDASLRGRQNKSAPGEGDASLQGAQKPDAPNKSALDPQDRQLERANPNAIPEGSGLIVTVRIDKSAQQMVVSVNGVRRYRWPVSTGRSGYPTPSGTFIPFRLEADHYSKEWDDAPMPHSIFFTEKGHAIHGSFETRHIGAPASAGCVRLAPANAAKLFALVSEKGLWNTKIVLTGSERVALDRWKREKRRRAIVGATL
jgi:lipoprotein-anchoring transpeptidase ErfK/SrfK